MGRAKFEVQVQRDGRWIVEAVVEDEGPAIREADKILARANCQAVRVVRDRLGRETTVYEKDRGGSANGANVAASAITEAADCADVEDLYALPARMTAAKVLRRWLDANKLTPLETLHNYRALSRLMDSDPQVYPSAVDRVATLQAKARGTDARQRRDELYRLVEEAASRARRAEGEKAVWKLGLASYAKLCRTAEQVAWVPQDRALLIRSAVARDLIGQGSYLAKLDVLLATVTPDLCEEDFGILDEFIADVLGSPQTIQDILGERPNLSAALVALIDIMEGKPPAGRREPETVAVLRSMMAEGRLKSAWLVLRDRVVNEVSGARPLSRNDPAKETEAFQALVTRLLRFPRLGTGPQMAEALTSRCSRQFAEGGKTGLQLAIGTMGGMIADRSRRVHYYLDMLKTESGRQCLPMLGQAIQMTVMEAADIHAFVRVDESAHEKLAAIGTLQRALRGTALPPQLRDALVDRLDTLVARYLVQERVIERLDDPTDSLRIRAKRLVHFVASGLLIEGKAMALARSRVVEHLKRPNFIEDFTADIKDPTHKETAVRDFWLMLTTAGFGGTGGKGGGGGDAQPAAAIASS
ncbi:hypothetical protein [Caenispirillum bisanense]|uniref:hypothetical protein n=1 Tax=Caenispirillum bisanense TaxID=414052 RepID=UPI0031D7F0DD